MAAFHIDVRTYQWTTTGVAKQVLVESPVLDLTTRPSALIIRPLEGKNKNEPRTVPEVGQELHELDPESPSPTYRTEAHGVLVPEDSQGDLVPLWVHLQSYQPPTRRARRQRSKSKLPKVAVKEEQQIGFVDLQAFESQSASVARICWVPSLEGSDGSMYTVTGGEREWSLPGADRIKIFSVVQQKFGRPMETQSTQLRADELDNLVAINDDRKKWLFSAQLKSIQSLFQAPAKLAPSPLIKTSARSPVKVEAREKERILRRRPSSNCSIEDRMLDIGGYSSDEDSEVERMRRKRRTPAMSPKYSERKHACKCTYAGLLPSLEDPFPSHKHNADRDCHVGSQHKDHCVFADHDPTRCVIRGPRTTHKHCSDLALGSPEQAQAVGMFGDLTTPSVGRTTLDTSFDFSSPITPVSSSSASSGAPEEAMYSSDDDDCSTVPDSIFSDESSQLCSPSSSFSFDDQDLPMESVPMELKNCPMPDLNGFVPSLDAVQPFTDMMPVGQPLWPAAATEQQQQQQQPFWQPLAGPCADPAGLPYNFAFAEPLEQPLAPQLAGPCFMEPLIEAPAHAFCFTAPMEPDSLPAIPEGNAWEGPLWRPNIDRDAFLSPEPPEMQY